MDLYGFDDCAHDIPRPSRPAAAPSYTGPAPLSIKPHFHPAHRPSSSSHVCDASCDDVDVPSPRLVPLPTPIPMELRYILTADVVQRFSTVPIPPLPSQLARLPSPSPPRPLPPNVPRPPKFGVTSILGPSVPLARPPVLARPLTPIPPNTLKRPAPSSGPRVLSSPPVSHKPTSISHKFPLFTLDTLAYTQHRLLNKMPKAATKDTKAKAPAKRAKKDENKPKR